MWQSSLDIFTKNTGLPPPQLPERSVSPSSPQEILDPPWCSWMKHTTYVSKNAMFRTLSMDGCEGYVRRKSFPVIRNEFTRKVHISENIKWKVKFTLVLVVEGNRDSSPLILWPAAHPSPTDDNYRTPHLLSIRLQYFLLCGWKRPKCSHFYLQFEFSWVYFIENIVSRCSSKLFIAASGFSSVPQRGQTQNPPNGMGANLQFCYMIVYLKKARNR